jgi:hypothetical protein
VVAGRGPTQLELLHGFDQLIDQRRCGREPDPWFYRWRHARGATARSLGSPGPHSALTLASVRKSAARIDGRAALVKPYLFSPCAPPLSLRDDAGHRIESPPGHNT